MLSVLEPFLVTTMNSDDKSFTGLRWNAGGWFGGVLGSSAWMAVCAVLLLSYGQPGIAVINLACFSAVNLIGLYLWSRRHKVSAISALLILSSVLAFAVPIAWMTTTHLASNATLEAMNWPTSSVVTAAVLFAAPAFSVFILRRASRLTALTEMKNAR